MFLTWSIVSKLHRIDFISESFTFSTDIGAAAMVHDNTEIPLLDTYGLHLMPGQKYKLNYKKQASYFLSAPYTKCIDQPPLSMDPVLVNYPHADYSYSQNLCYRYIIQIFTYADLFSVHRFIFDFFSVIKCVAVSIQRCGKFDIYYFQKQNN